MFIFFKILKRAIVAPVCNKSDMGITQHLVRKRFGLKGIFSGSRVFGADVSCEFGVALLPEVVLHLVNGFANEWPRRIEHPSAFGAGPALKARSFDPNQSSTDRLHCHLGVGRGCAFLKDG